MIDDMIVVDNQLYFWKTCSSNYTVAVDSKLDLKDLQKVYFRAGIPTENRSKIRDNSRAVVGYEEGVSVWEAYLCKGKVIPIAPSGFKYNSKWNLDLHYGITSGKIYLVEGELLNSIGSDGEPLLHNIKVLNKVERYTALDYYCGEELNFEKDKDTFIIKHLTSKRDYYLEEIMYLTRNIERLVQYK